MPPPPSTEVDWEDIYRQMEDKERPSDTREVEFRHFTPSQSDVQNLIAAIAKIEKKERTYVTSDRRTEKDEANPPASSPTRKDWRLSKVLDSIANLCVSETKHEVIATALRVHNKAELIELIIASIPAAPLVEDVSNSVTLSLTLFSFLIKYGVAPERFRFWKQI